MSRIFSKLLLLAATAAAPVAALSAISASKRLLQLASSPNTTLLPGVYDALSARILGETSQALFLSGFGISASALGQPDAGILTYTELEQVTRRICDCVNVPVVVDGDTGFGGPSNVRRTVRGLAAAGAAAVTIEDQVFPKKCTYIAGEGVRVVDRSDSVARLKTALHARDEAREQDGNEILVVGRTDCRAALGFDEALERCLAYQELNCDLVYAENLASADEYQELRRHISKPMILAQVQLMQEKQTLYSLSDMTDMGYNFALMGVTALQATVAALQSVSKELADNGIVTGQKPPLSSFETVKETVGFGELQDFEDKHYCE